MSALTICQFCVVLVALAFSRGANSLNDLRICTTVDCPNDHIEVVNGIDGAIHRYSKNAANFQETKASPSPAKVVQQRGNVNQLSSGLSIAAERQHPTNVVGQNGHQNAHVSVLGDGGGMGQRVQRQQQQHVKQPPLQKLSYNSHLQQQRHDQQHHHHQQHQQQQQRQQLNQRHMQFSTTKQASSQMPPPGGKQAPQNATRRVHAVEDGIYWSVPVEGAIPPGLRDSVTETWKKRIRQLRVVRVENASLDKCGSNMNRHVVFDDGSTACARYRHPMVQFVLGDLYCYYLARMLGLQNVPTVVLSHVSNDSSSQWSSVTADIRNAGWEEDTMASFSLWIENIGTSHLPEIMYNNQHETIFPSTPGFADLNITQLVELAQYSDLMVFDYITLHLDRMTIRKNAVEYYQQDWLFKGEVHNLAKHQTNGGLWFIDNENGLFNSYAVAYSKTNRERMQRYHEELLRSFCVFRRSTFDKVHELARMEDPFKTLDEMVHDKEPVVDTLRSCDRLLMKGLNERLKTRLDNVVQWMDNCQSRSGG